MDYKTGAAAREAAAGYRGGRSLQLPVYLHAAAHGQLSDLAACGAELHYVSERAAYARLSLSGAQLASDPRSGEVLAAMAEAIASGAFFYQPGERRAHCRWCDFRDIAPGGAQVILESDLPRPIPMAKPPATTFPGDLADRWQEQQARHTAHLEQGPVYITPSLLAAEAHKEPRETEPRDRCAPERTWTASEMPTGRSLRRTGPRVWHSSASLPAAAGSLGDRTA